MLDVLEIEPERPDGDGLSGEEGGLSRRRAREEELRFTDAENWDMKFVGMREDDLQRTAFERGR